MWAMTSFGILMPAIRPPKTVRAGDSRTLQIRSRRAKDLDILRAKYMQKSLGQTLHTPKFDYEYRAYCEPAAFGLAMAQMVMEIDYLKFKPTTVANYQDSDLHDVYNKIWGVVINNLSTAKHRYDYFSSSSKTQGAPPKLPFWSKADPYFGRRDEPSTGSGYSGASYGMARAALPASVDDWSPDELDKPLPEEVDENSDFELWRDRPLTDKERWEDDVDYRVNGWDDLTLGDLAGGSKWAEEAADRAARLSAELDSLIEEGPPERIDHSECGHSNSDSARSRCRRRKMREWGKQVNEVRMLAEASLAEEAREIEQAEASRGVYVGAGVEGVASAE